MGRTGQDRRFRLRIPGLHIFLILQGFSQHFQVPCNRRATEEPFSLLADESPEGFRHVGSSRSIF